MRPLEQLQQLAHIPPETTNWLVDVVVPFGGVLLTVGVTVWLALFIHKQAKK